MHRRDARDLPTPGPALVAGWPGGRYRRGLAAGAVAATAAALGIAAVRLEDHYARLSAAGGDLGPLQNALAEGSGPRTAWVGWVTAMLFVLSTLRVVRGAPEPPAGIDAGSGIGAMRRALRRELDLVRRALAIVLGLTVLDIGRLVATAVDGARGPGSSRDTLAWVAVEAAGLGAATAALAWWCWTFRRQCRDLGAL